MGEVSGACAGARRAADMTAGGFAVVTADVALPPGAPGVDELTAAGDLADWVSMRMAARRDNNITMRPRRTFYKAASILATRGSAGRLTAHPDRRGTSTRPLRASARCNGRLIRGPAQRDTPDAR